MDKFWRPLGKETESKCILDRSPDRGNWSNRPTNDLGRPIAVKGTSDIVATSITSNARSQRRRSGGRRARGWSIGFLATLDVGSVLRAFAAWCTINATIAFVAEHIYTARLNRGFESPLFIIGIYNCHTLRL